MKISAHFYTVDEAEAAAAALKADPRGVFDITVNENTASVGGRHENVRDTAPMGMITQMNSGGMSAAMTIPLVNASNEAPLPSGGAEVEIICRASESRRVSGILINRGGHALRGK